MKTLNKIIRIISIIILALILFLLFSHFIQMNRVSKTKFTSLVNPQTQSIDEILKSVDEITIEKKILSLRKHYYVMSDGVLIGEIKGKLFPLFGDVLKFNDIHGNLIKKESQIKRLGLTQIRGFNISLNRLAEIKNKNNDVTGYIGEKKLKDWWRIKRIQYFYNEDYKVKGFGKPNSIFFNKDFKVYDNNDSIDYIIDGNFFSPISKYTINIIDNSDIDVEDVIFYTIIENSIINSKLKESSSKNNTKK